MTQFVIIEENKVVTVGMDKSIFPIAVEAPDDIIFGDLYVNGEFQKAAPRPEPIILSPAQLREIEYETNKLIVWEGVNITVDQANLVYWRYAPEGNIKATEIQGLIVGAKEYIRGLYPED